MQQVEQTGQKPTSHKVRNMLTNDKYRSNKAYLVNDLLGSTKRSISQAIISGGLCISSVAKEHRLNESTVR